MASVVEEPSRPQNAYWLWLSENRAALTKEAGSAKGPVVGKLAGEKWKVLAASQKAPYEKTAAEKKAAYEKAMEAFKAAGGQPGKRRQEKADAKKGREEKKAKKEARKASGRPSKPPSSYWLWLGDNRDAIAKEAGSKKPPVVAKLAGEKWKALPASQKAPYEKMAAEKKATYDKEFKEWQEKASNKENLDDEDGEEENDENDDE